ncbi:cytochrome P450 [Nonomuraea longicatena]|uniref:Cytochrome P450 n=1 Tax=Nonomuraea longicatena TaxID=83682 RepID=A0ABP4AHH7_9ACTN
MVNIGKKYDIPQHFFWLHGPIAKPPVEYDEKTEMWNVYGYREAMEIFGDPETYSSNTLRVTPKELLPDEGVSFDGFLTQVDPPDHSKLRKLVSSAFTRKVVADLEPRIAEITCEFLDQARERDRFELVSDLAYPLPITVIAELLGVPSSDRGLFKAWADELFKSDSTITRKASEKQQAQAQDRMRTWHEMSAYLGSHADERRRRPRADLLTRLVEAEVDGERLPDDQVVNFGILLLLAGHITTTVLLGNTVLCLDAYPDEQRRARADRSTIPDVIEESLRLLTPFAMMARSTTREVKLSGHKIGADELVLVWLAAANRDPLQFPDPELFVPGREHNPHLAFGRGIHFCLGAPLARLEGRIAIDLLLDRFDDLRVEPGSSVELIPTPTVTGVKRLHLA